MPKTKIPKPPTLKSSKIPAKATVVTRGSLGDAHPVFSFIHASDNDCLLSEWAASELAQLMATFKKMEALTWNELPRHAGLSLDQVSNYSKPLPPKVSPDVTVLEVRVDDRKRLFGYRAGDVFRVLWFDRNHEVCPYRKQRRA